MIVMDAGLASGKEIAKAGKKVVVLEARNRLGGRIHTLNVTGFSTHIEAGAELAQERMKQLYEQKGYSQKWIEKRVRGIAIRQELTDEWKQRGIDKNLEYAILTNEISKATFGKTVDEYKNH